MFQEGWFDEVARTTQRQKRDIKPWPVMVLAPHISANMMTLLATFGQKIVRTGYSVGCVSHLNDCVSKVSGTDML